MHERRLRAVGGWCALLAFALSAMFAPATCDAALAPGDLVVADAKAFGGGAVLEVNPLTGAESVIASNETPVNKASQLFDLPFTLALDQDGDILVANTGNLGGSCSGGCGGVISVNSTTGAESVLSSNALPVNASSQYFVEPTGIATGPQGQIFVANWNGVSRENEVIGVDPATGKETLISSNSMPVNASSGYFTYIQGLVVDQAGEVFAADPLAFGGTGGIIEVNPSSGKETEISANSVPVNASSQYFHAPSQLVFNAAGRIVVADWCSTASGCGGVIEVDPQTGKETLLSSNSLPINLHSQYFDEATAVALDASGRIIAVQEGGLGGICKAGCGGLLYVDPATGQESELSSNSFAVNAFSEFFSEPFDVAVVGVSPSGSGSAGSGAPPAPRAPAQPSSPPIATSTRQAPPVISALAQSHRRWRRRAARAGAER